MVAYINVLMPKAQRGDTERRRVMPVLMHGDAALSADVRRGAFPNSRLKGDANLLIMPTLDAANIAFNLLKTAAGDGITVGPILLGVETDIQGTGLSDGRTALSGGAWSARTRCRENLPSSWRMSMTLRKARSVRAAARLRASAPPVRNRPSAGTVPGSQASRRS